MTKNNIFDGYSDEELIDKYKAGDQKAFVELDTRFKRRVFSYCLKMIGNRETAEDLFQEIFVRVSTKRDSFISGSFSAWLFSIARNLCLNAIRDRVEHSSIDDITEGQAGIVQAQEYDQTPELLKEAIEKLPDDLREVLVLRVYNEFSYEEIAEMTKTKLATVKVRIFRAKQKLHESLSPYFKD